MPNTTPNNSIFRGDEPTWANACVGENGSPQITEYANGFSKAANLLINQVVQDEGLHSYVDELIYPICFSIRHSLELHLKNTIIKLTKLADYRHRKLPEFKLISTHDLKSFWQFIKSNAMELDKRYEPILLNLDKYVGDIASVDLTGQVFRYPFDTENRKHLVEVAIINVVVLKQRLIELEELLRDLNNLNNNLINEYSCGTFTTKLSRPELFELASKLPKRSEWRSEEFIVVKARLRSEYGLSSNDFCRALNIIQSNYELSQLIDAVPPLKDITEPILHIFFDGWSKLHDIEKVRNPSHLDLDNLIQEWPGDFQDESNRWAELTHWWGANSETFTPNRIAELQALYYFHMDLPYSEHFKFSRELFNRRIATASQAELRCSSSDLIGQ